MPSLREQFLKHVAQTSPLPMLLEIERAEGVWMYDPAGKRYLDLIAGISVSSIGHSDPDVVKAVQEQAGKFMHLMVYGEYIMAPQVKLAGLLTEHLPSNLDSVYFVNSGTEATEGAMKLAKRVTGRMEIFSAFDAYHGSTQGAVSLMSDSYFTRAFRPLLPGIRHLHFNSVDDLNLITEATAAVIVETVQAEAGVIRPKDDYLKKLRARCNETGALLIFDEIQVGYGRTGSLFAFEQYGVVPDILLLAKAMGGGMPIGAFVSSRENMQRFTENPVLGHITTFGGHPVTCAAGLVTLNKLLSTDYISKVKEKSRLFVDLLKHPAILEVRQAGFLMAVELGDFDLVQAVIKEALNRGLIVDWFLFNNTSIRIAPPLIITEEEIRWACQQLVEAIDLVTGSEDYKHAPKISY